MEQRHAAELEGLRGSLRAGAEELRQLGASLDTTREEKFALQAQVTELRAALQTSSTQVKVSDGAEVIGQGQDGAEFTAGDGAAVVPPTSRGLMPVCASIRRLRV